MFLCLVSQNSTICFLPCHLLTNQVENTQWIGCYKFWFYSFVLFFVFFSWLLEIVADALNPNSLCYCAHYVVPVFFLSVSIRKHKPLLHPPVCPSRVIDLWFNPLYSKMKTFFTYKILIDFCSVMTINNTLKKIITVIQRLNEAPRILTRDLNRASDLVSLQIILEFKPCDNKTRLSWCYMWLMHKPF